MRLLLVLSSFLFLGHFAGAETGADMKAASSAQSTFDGKETGEDGIILAAYKDEIVDTGKERIDDLTFVVEKHKVTKTYRIADRPKYVSYQGDRAASEGSLVGSMVGSLIGMVLVAGSWVLLGLFFPFAPIGSWLVAFFGFLLVGTLTGLFVGRDIARNKARARAQKDPAEFTRENYYELNHLSCS